MRYYSVIKRMSKQASFGEARATPRGDILHTQRARHLDQRSLCLYQWFVTPLTRSTVTQGALNYPQQICRHDAACTTNAWRKIHGFPGNSLSFHTKFPQLRRNKKRNNKVIFTHLLTWSFFFFTWFIYQFSRLFCPSVIHPQNSH